MKGWFFIIISILLIPLVFAADNPSQDEVYNNILEKLKKGEIDTKSIRIISQGIPSKNQKNFINEIGRLKKGKEKVFWESFWKLSPKDRSDFINSFETKSKNDLLNIFSNQYVKHTKRKDPILKFNLEGDVDVRLIKTKEGNEFLVLGNKYILLDWFKRSYWDKEPYTIDYDSKTDTIVKTRGDNVFSIKGGKIILGKDIFYVLDSDNKPGKSHALSGMTEIHGNIALDLTGDEYKMSINSYGKGGGKRFSSVGLKNGMRISSFKEFDKTAEMIFDKEGKIKSIENLKMNTNPHIASNHYYETINGKMRFISDVEGFLDSNGKIDSERMREFMLEGGKESKYDGYFVFDKEGGKNGKPFIAAVAEGVGIREFGRLTNEALQRKKLDTIGKLFGGDTQEQKTGSMLSSLNIDQLNKAQEAIDGLRGIAKAKGEVSGETFFEKIKREGKNVAKDLLTPKAIKNIAYLEIDKVLRPLLGEGLNDIDREVFSNTEFLDSVQNAVNRFKNRLEEDPKYFERYNNERFKLEEGIPRQTRKDFDALMGVIGKIDSIYDAIIPKSTITLRGDVGTLVVGGNVEVFNDDLKITENLNGISFGAGIISERDTFNIRYPIDKIYTTNNENIWNIRKNSEGGLEPFMVGSEKPNVEINRLNFRSIIRDKDYSSNAWWHDFFSWKENEILGRTLDPVFVSLKVSEDAKKSMKKARGAVKYHEIEGAYELSARFLKYSDPSGKSQAKTISVEAGRKVSVELGKSSKEIQEMVKTLKNPIKRERKLKDPLKKKTQSSFLQETLVSLIMEMPSSNVAQAGVDFISKGYTSYGNLRDVNVGKAIEALNFIDASLSHIRTEYNSRNGLSRDLSISLVRKQNGDLFLKNSRGKVFSVDSELESFVGEIIPILANVGIRKISNNKALSEKGYRFLKVDTFK